RRSAHALCVPGIRGSNRIPANPDPGRERRDPARRRRSHGREAARFGTSCRARGVAAHAARMAPVRNHYAGRAARDRAGRRVLGQQIVKASQGVSTDVPVVLRPSRSRWAFAASFSAYFWLIGILTLPLPTTSNNSLAVASKSSRLAV